MKNKLFIYVGLAASLLCSCAQSDVDNGQQQGSTVLHITATAPGGDATRVSVGADPANGLITKWVSGEQLNVWNLYNSSPLSGQTFTKTTTAEEQTALFAYSTNSIFTPGSTIYAFNNLPSGGGTYTQNNNSGTFAISLSGYGSQDGTLANMAKYDALCGTTTAKMDGKSSSLMMNHLTAAMCFNFINADFTGTTTLKKFAVNCESATKSFLPVSCTATLNAAGDITFGTPTGIGQWMVTNSSIAPSVDGTIKVYLMTFPFKNISGSLELIAQTSAGKYYSRAVTMNGLSLGAGTVYNRPADMTLINLPYYGSILKSNYYMWDAAYPYGGGTGVQYFLSGYGYNPTGNSGYDNYASQSCKTCPTARQIYAYLRAGAYLDPGDPIKMDDGSYSYPPSYTAMLNDVTQTGATITYNTYDPFTHALVSGSPKGNGVWLPKNVYIKSTLWSKIPGLTSGQGVENYTGTPEVGKDMIPTYGGKVTTAALAASIRNSGNYFYLPADGYYNSSPPTNNDPPHYIGTNGNWWSSSVTPTNNSCYVLHFDNDGVYLNYYYRDYCYPTWTIK